MIKEPEQGWSQSERYVPPGSNKYDYAYFSPEESPEGLLLAKQIQAQSYKNMGFVRSEGLVEVSEWGGQVFAEGERPKILADDVSTPVEPSGQAAPHRTEYVLGVEKDSTDCDPETGKMLTWKKMYAPLDTLPAYQLCRDGLWDGWEEYLRAVDEHSLVEIEAMGKTERAGAKAIAELMKNELLRVQGNGEIWYFTIVSSTFDAFDRMWGPLAIRKVGNPQPLRHQYISQEVRVVPGIINVDKFYRNMFLSIRAASNPYAHKNIAMFLYMTEGVSDDMLGAEVAEFRQNCEIIMQLRGAQ